VVFLAVKTRHNVRWNLRQSRLWGLLQFRTKWESLAAVWYPSKRRFVPLWRPTFAIVLFVPIRTAQSLAWNLLADSAQVRLSAKWTSWDAVLGYLTLERRRVTQPLYSEDFCYEGSIYVPQGNLFTLDADLLPANLFCRVWELSALRMGFKMDEPAWRYSYKPWPGAPGCVDANGGYEVGMVALHHVESMWDAYHDVPKFAYVNSIAAHQYDNY
jgi:hypothetical protein